MNGDCGVCERAKVCVKWITNWVDMYEILLTRISIARKNTINLPSPTCMHLCINSSTPFTPPQSFAAPHRYSATVQAEVDELERKPSCHRSRREIWLSSVMWTRPWLW
ncbi:hypothetical protein BC938DRAFT_483706 [Jimgerdemannia flammicorona]|uniref:Uncharacterized protein n=1 Tax=Jimgerdemannia flammicorona TaxID=994334 RepID=A0A433QBE5_9FUNG|nr:hypothetical protein BC938DRAFT_483706 [Jimgerdemannia flammicorona]